MNGPAGRRPGRRASGLLDRQIIDRDGRMAGKVDDLERVIVRAGAAEPIDVD